MMLSEANKKFIFKKQGKMYV